MWSLGKRRFALVTFALAFAGLAGCKRSKPDASTDPESRPTAEAVGVNAPGPLRVLVVYSSEKKQWLDEQIALFNKTNPKLPTGAGFVIEGKAMGSGEAMQDILDD